MNIDECIILGIWNPAVIKYNGIISSCEHQGRRDIGENNDNNNNNRLLLSLFTNSLWVHKCCEEIISGFFRNAIIPKFHERQHNVCHIWKNRFCVVEKNIELTSKKDREKKKRIEMKETRNI